MHSKLRQDDQVIIEPMANHVQALTLPNDSISRHKREHEWKKCRIV